VHHIVPLNEIRETYTVHPIDDLRPVCPNCHAMLHPGGEIREIDDVKGMLEAAASAAMVDAGASV